MAADRPVLPWGSNVATTTNVITDLISEVMKLRVGEARIQVLWEIGPEEDDEGDDNGTPVWWPAVIHCQAENHVTDAQGRKAYILRYDPMPEYGWEGHDEQIVSFISDHDLFCLADGEFHVWRLQGSDYQPPLDGEYGTKVTRDANGDEWMKLGDVSDHLNTVASLAGVDTDSLAAQMLQSVPLEMQHSVAEKYRIVMDTFKEEMKRVVAESQQKTNGDENGGATHIHKDDVDTMLERIKERLGNR